jgi:hypothetical protein
VTGAGLLRANALRLPLADRSVHLVITSPPYFALRSYRDGDEHFDGQIGSEPTPTDFLLALWAVMDECWRVLDDGGSAWINLGDKYAGSGGHNNATLGKTKGAGTKSGRATRRGGWDRYNQAADVRKKSLMGTPWRFAMGLLMPDLYRAHLEPAACWHDDGPGPCRTCPPRTFPQWIGRAEMIWNKPNSLPESVTDRPRRSHEQWFMVTKQPRYFAAVDEVREVQAGSHGQAKRSATISSNGGTNHRAMDKDLAAFNPLGKLPGSVRSVPSEPLRVPEFFVSDDGEHWRAFAPPATGQAQQEVRRRLWELAVERHAAGLALHVATVDHFAAFPSEWPRWIIAGWSPSGICTACGEPRRPTTTTTTVPSPVHGAGSIMGSRNGGPDERQWDGLPRFNREHRIIGYACACPDDSAPTRPAVVLDPFAGTGTVPMMARAMGRYGVGVDLSRDYLRLARWRVFESGHGEKRLAKVALQRKPRPPARKPAPAYDQP